MLKSIPAKPLIILCINMISLNVLLYSSDLRLTWFRRSEYEEYERLHLLKIILVKFFWICSILVLYSFVVGFHIGVLYSNFDLTYVVNNFISVQIFLVFVNRIIWYELAAALCEMLSMCLFHFKFFSIIIPRSLIYSVFETRLLSK